MANLRSLVEKHYENVATANLKAEAEIFSPDVVSVEPAPGDRRHTKPGSALSPPLGPEESSAVLPRGAPRQP
jgi:hypothetical protein